MHGIELPAALRAVGKVEAVRRSDGGRRVHCMPSIPSRLRMRGCDVGHIALANPADGEPPLCRCGNAGCGEAYASGWALVRDLAMLGYGIESIDDVVRLARDGNPDAVRLVRRAAQGFGAAVSDLVSILNPEVVAIGGQLAAIEDLLFAGIREVVYRRSLPLATRSLSILPSALARGTRRRPGPRRTCGGPRVSAGRHRSLVVGLRSRVGAREGSDRSAR